MEKGLLFEELVADVTIDKMDKIVPTIGIVPYLPNYNTSGSIVVMTDSACLDSVSSSLIKCFFLLEKFIKIATAETGYYYYALD